MLTQSIHRFCLFALVALCGLGTVSTKSAFAGECGCESVCAECPPNACDCPCDCGPRIKCPKPVFKALDLVAGGIEKVLGLDKINCCCGGGCDGGCDEAYCDDGCDAATLYEISQPSQPHYQHHGHQIAPAPPALPLPTVESAPRAYRSHDLHQQIQSPQMRMGEPSFVDPQPIADPGAIAPPIHPQEVLRNPFLDDARVISKRRVRPTSYEQSKGKPKRKVSPTKKQDPRYSRSYTPSQRLARTVR